MARRAPRALVVDGDLHWRAVHSSALRAGGFEVDECACSSRAERRAAEFRPDLLVLELHFDDDIDGAVIARRLGASRRLGVVFVASRPSIDDVTAAFAAGADDLVRKPYEATELVARAHAVLRRSEQADAHVHEVGDLCVDEDAHTATIGGEVVDLSPIEFGLLVALARSHGHVLPKARLLDLVWCGDAYDVNLVEVHISCLRRKLRPYAPDAIRTVRGVGYALGAATLQPQLQLAR